MDNVYQAPASDLTLPEDRPAYSTSQSPFFVTSIPKLLLLYLATLGTYSIYWFYKHWQIQKRVQGADVSPALRSIFQLLFTHSLFARIADAYYRETFTVWRYSGVAWLYIIAGLLSRVADKAAERATEINALHAASLLTLLLTVLPLCIAQKHANSAARDPKGLSNKHIGKLNLLFIIPGGLFWAFAFLGYAIMAGLVPESALAGIGVFYEQIFGTD
ncbi:MAG: hypothetical protein ACRERR_09495 [Moraxellaceae bacterium]